MPQAPRRYTTARLCSQPDSQCVADLVGSISYKKRSIKGVPQQTVHLLPTHNTASCGNKNKRCQSYLETVASNRPPSSQSGDRIWVPTPNRKLIHSVVFAQPVHITGRVRDWLKYAVIIAHSCLQLMYPLSPAITMIITDCWFSVETPSAIKFPL